MMRVKKFAAALLAVAVAADGDAGVGRTGNQL